MPIALRIGGILTFAWLIVLAKYLSWSWEKLAASEPNQVGDFLAGCCAPLAFLWLTVAVFLQKEELAAQRRELEQNRQALLLQADELKNSVAQLVAQNERQSAQRAEEVLNRRISDCLVELMRFSDRAFIWEGPPDRPRQHKILPSRQQLNEHFRDGRLEEAFELVEQSLRHFRELFPRVASTTFARNDFANEFLSAAQELDSIAKEAAEEGRDAIASRVRALKLESIASMLRSNLETIIGIRVQRQ